MFKDRDPLAEYRLLEFPNETAASWPIAGRDRDELPIRRLPDARDAERTAGDVKKIAA